MFIYLMPVFHLQSHPQNISDICQYPSRGWLAGWLADWLASSFVSSFVRSFDVLRRFQLRSGHTMAVGRNNKRSRFHQVVHSYSVSK